MRLIIYTILALLAFAGNSLLCRIALHETNIDPVSFTTIRLVSGALCLLLIVYLVKRQSLIYSQKSWRSALWLFVYAICFSLSYIGLSAGTGALILFATVQLTMLSLSWWKGDFFSKPQWLGFVMAWLGLVYLFLPGVTAPPLTSALLMIGSGIAWALYTLRGQQGGDPTHTTALNFIYSIPFALVLSMVGMSNANLDAHGVIYAVLSGAITSGVGYAIWYAVLPSMKASTAASLQLSVPVIAAVAGVVLLDEMLTWRLSIASISILGGVGVVLYFRQKKAVQNQHGNQ
ncbi:MAG: EamA family transporter [Alteromonadaceae bacterium]|nr:EamA family transporter [Alteromonadaceae bacterium]